MRASEPEARGSEEHEHFLSGGIGPHHRLPLVRQHNDGLIVIGHLQMMRGSANVGDGRRRSIGDLARPEGAGEGTERAALALS